MEVILLARTLKYLDISGNYVACTGEELKWIAEMKELHHLDVHLNNFDYEGIPPVFANNSSLEYLDVSYTLFYGALKSNDFEGMNKLTHLDLSGNWYSSSIPVELASLPYLQNLGVEDSNILGNL